MKIIILAILGVCAVAAATENVVLYEEEITDFESPVHAKIFESLMEKVKKIIEKAKNEYEIVSINVKKVLLKIYQEIHSIAAESKEKLDALKEDVHKKFDELKVKGEISIECGENLKTKYENVENEAVENVKDCTANVFEGYEKKYRKDIEKDIDQIKQDLGEFSELIYECVSMNPLATIKCVHEKSSKFEKLIKNGIDASVDALKIARDRAVEAVSEVRSCNQAVFKKVYNEVKDLNVKLEQCF